MQLQYLVLTAVEYWQITAALLFAALGYYLYRKLEKQYKPKRKSKSYDESEIYE